MLSTKDSSQDPVQHQEREASAQVSNVHIKQGTVGIRGLSDLSMPAENTGRVVLNSHRPRARCWGSPVTQLT